MSSNKATANLRSYSNPQESISRDQGLNRAFGINRQNKITYEWAFYDSALLPKVSPYKE